MKTRQRIGMKRMISTLALLLAVGTIHTQAAPPEIPKTDVDTAEMVQGSSKSGYTPAQTIDGNAGIFWEGAGGFPYCIRYDFGAAGRKRFVQFDFRPYHGYTFSDWEVYVTDSTSTAPADWGAPLASGTVPVAPPGLSLPDEVMHIAFESPVNGRFLMLRMLNGATRSLVSEVWFYGADAGPFFLADPVALSMYTESSRQIAFLVGDPDVDQIQADLVIDNSSGSLAAATVAGSDVLAGGDDVFSFNTASGWDANEGQLTLTASAVTGRVTVSVIESDTGGYTPQAVLRRDVTVEISPRVLSLSSPSFVVLAGSQTTDITISAPAPASGAITITAGTPIGVSATISAIGGALVIADGGTDAPGVVRITASGDTAGVTTLALTADNGFVWAETGTDTITIRASVLTDGIIHVAADGNDTTGDGSVANPLRTLTAAARHVSLVPTVYMGPGYYRAGDGEDYPLSIPAGLTVVGTMGSAQDASDSTVLDAGGVKQALTLASTASGTSGLLKNLVVTNFLGGAINATQWRGRIDTCLITGAVPGPAPAAVIYHTSGNTDLIVTNTIVCNIVNTQTSKIVNYVTGAGPVVFAGCTFENITVQSTSLLNHDGVFYFNGFDVVVRDTLFDNLVCSSTSANIVGSFILAHNKAMLFERNIVRNISETGTIVGGSNAGTSTIRNCLFYNLNANGWAVVGGYSTTWNVYNCTFADCSAPFITDAAFNYGNFYNCNISDCDTLNPFAASDRLVLHNANVYNTPLVNYDTVNSVAVTTNAPLFRDEAARDYRLRVVSPLVDAGDNARVGASSPNDLDLVTRILDGDGDGTATVDIGCYEVNTVAPSAPMFVAAQPSYTLGAGGSLTVEIDILPDAGSGPVVADILYGTNLNGAATLTFPSGAGPSQLVVTADSTLDNPGGMSIVTLTEQTSQGVVSGEFGIFLFEPEVTINQSGRLFVRSGATNTIRVSVVGGATAGSQVEITPGTRTGSGDNAIAWQGNAYIAAGESESDGYLEIVGGSGANNFELTIGGGYKFIETDATTVTIDVVGYPGVLYIDSASGDDDNTGELSSPLHTITYALGHLEAGDEIRLLPGTYSPATETLPILPGGVRLVGTGTGPADVVLTAPAADVRILDYVSTPAGEDGYVENVTFTGCTKPAIRVNNAVVVLSNCVFTGIAAGSDAAAFDIVNDSDVTVNDCSFRGLSGVAVIHTRKDPTDGAEFTANRCTFISNTVSGATLYNYNISEPISTFRLNDCRFENNATTVPTSGAWPQGASVAGFVGGQLYMNRCTVIGGGASGWMFNLVRMTCVVRDSLFVNHYPTYGLIKGYGHTLTFVNCTFTKTKGGFNAWGNTAWFRNCIIADSDSLNYEVAAQVGLTQCLLWNTPLGGGYNTGSSNIVEADPLFVHIPDPFDAGALDAGVRWTSPAVDAGNNSHVTTTYDLDSNPRIVDGNKDQVATVDLGAYERGEAPPRGSVIVIQ